jgi:hypothetical protein
MNFCKQVGRKMRKKLFNFHLIEETSLCYNNSFSFLCGDAWWGLFVRLKWLWIIVGDFLIFGWAGVVY